MKKKETNKLIIAIIAVLLIIAIVGGATFAYWSWETNTAQRTTVNVTVTGATMTIAGDDVSNTFSDNKGMYPTADCDGAGALIGSTATVTVDNDTESPMQASLKIRATLSSSHGTLTTEQKDKLNWAIVELASENASVADNACASTTYKGTLSTATTNTDIDTGIRFIANGSSETKKYYKIYIWLDSSYTHKNSGNVINDPMQDLTLSVKWSEASALNQQY